MHIDAVPNRGSRPAYLLRESFRDGRKVRKRTLANLSALPDEQIFAIRAVLRGEKLHPADELFEAIASRPHGHVEAVRVAMQRLGFESLVASRRCPERDLVCAMVAARVLAPHTKLATTRWWHTTTLAEECDVVGADADALYAAMDWLLARQGTIEKKLAARHLGEGSLVLYDLSSSYFEGTTCPLAKRGHNRDGKKGKLQVNYGLLTDRRGCPVAVSVYDGNTTDAKTLMPQVDKLKKDFGLQTVVLVGDRGMISQKAIDELREQDQDQVAWITALKTGQIRALVDAGQLQLGLFDEKNLFELSHPDFPGERLIACRNPELAKLRSHTRQSLLEATEKELQKVKGMVERGRLSGRDAIGVRVGKVINKYKVAKHFALDIEDHRFGFQRLRGPHRCGSGPRRHLHHPHEPGEKADDGRRLRAPLQVTGSSRAGLPLAEDHRSEDPADSPSSRRSRQKPHLSLHARLLRRVAHARGLAPLALRRRGSTRQSHP